MVTKPTYEELEQKIKSLETELTEKDQTESALRASEELYRACFEKAKIPITVIDIETRERVFFNREAHESFGYTESEYKKLKTSELDADESAEEVAAHLMKISSEGSDIFEAMHKTKNGEIRNSLINSVSLPLKDHNYLLSIRVDITDLKKTQKALQENEEKYRSFFEHAGFPIILFDAETGERVDFNRAAYESLGYARDEYQNTKPMDVEQEEGLNEMTEHLKKILKNGSDIFETRHVRKDGEIRETLNSAVGLRIGGRSLIHNIGVDITDRKRAEDALRDSEERYRSLVENIDMGVTLIDSSYNIVMINPTQSRVFSKTEDRIIGKKCYREFNGLDDPCVYCPGTNVLTSGKPEEVEKASVLDDGSQHYVNIKAFPILGPDKSVTGFIEVTEDITEKKRLEIQLHRAQRMEALGTLAGGIAHDFNNLLMGIQGRTSLILSEKANTQSAVDHLKGIEDHIKSATDLTNQLLGFARGGKYEVTSTDLNELIKKQSDMFGRTRKEITINETYSEDLWNINVDKGQIEQVILNLYVNAWHAMPGGGHIYVQTENMILDDNYVKPYEIKPGNYVKISITDTGTGMDEATKRRIFEPFFTTKEMGRGTGLGLASVYGVIKNHGGFINVYSQKGEGTSFNFYLPASSGVVNKIEEQPVQTLKGSETILLVDDEEIIIDVASQILETLGYTVKTATNGKEAIDLYKKEKDIIDLVILDMIMPDMNGGETFDNLKEFNPEIKVLLSSGYSLNGKAAGIIDRGCSGFIQKPFNMNGLSIKLREILGV